MVLWGTGVGRHRRRHRRPTSATPGGASNDAPHLGEQGREPQAPGPRATGQGEPPSPPPGNAGGRAAGPAERPGDFEELAGRLRDEVLRRLVNAPAPAAPCRGSRVGVSTSTPYARRRPHCRPDRVDDLDDCPRRSRLVPGARRRPRLASSPPGYRAEHDDLMPDTWRRHYCSASAAYSTTESAARQDGNHANRANEVLWFSPQLRDPGPTRPTLEAL